MPAPDPHTPPYRFWDARSGKNTATVTTPALNLYLAWSPDGQYMAASDKDGAVSILDIRRMKLAHKYSYKDEVSQHPPSTSGLHEAGWQVQPQGQDQPPGRQAGRQAGR
jgi:WD40 repeat protein